MRRGNDTSLARLRQACLAMAIGLGVVSAALTVWAWTATVEPIAEITGVVSAVARESMSVTDAYLDRAETAAKTAADLRPAASDQEERLALLHSVVRNGQDLDAAYFAYPNGDFEFVGVSLVDPSGFRTRVIRNATSANRTVTLTERDRDFALRSETEDTEDDYNPTSRPWWEGAVNATLPSQSYWTDAYRFSSSDEPGVTHARLTINAAGDVDAVIGVDVRLTELIAFLEKRKPSARGSAHVFGMDGTLVASSSADLAMPAALQEIITAHTKQLATPAEADNPLQHVWDNDGERTISAVTNVGDRDVWTLAVSAPTDDFLTGFRSRFAQLRGALVVVGVALTAAMALAGWWLLASLAKLHRDATTDPLTGLLNRAEAKHRMVELLSGQRPGDTVLVAIVDLDNFKLVNDQLGHRTGDRAIVAAAQFLERGVGNRGFVSRLGGDEFLLVLRAGGWSLEFVLTEVVRGVQSAVGEVVDDPNIPPVSASCGYHLHTTGRHEEPEALLRRADVALLNAKLNRDCCVRFVPGMSLPDPPSESRIFHSVR